jgi:hypothetical protein
MTRHLQGFSLALAASLVVLAAVGACGRDGPVAPGPAAPDGPSLADNPACDAGLGGEWHADSILAPETWSRADNPHRVGEQIVIAGAGVLTLEPGVLVCFGSYGRLYATNGGRLVANGLDTARIVLTGFEDVYGWNGIGLAGNPASPSTLKHVLVEHTGTSLALSTHDYHAALIDSAVFRQTMGLYLWGRGTSVSRSRVDTTTISGWPAVTVGTLVTFEANVVRGAAGIGLAVAGVHGVSLLGGRVEGSGGVGLWVSTTGAGFAATQPVRVVGGASYPAEMVVSAFPRIYATVAQQDSLLGNARDTLVVAGGILQQFAYPTQALPWRVTDDIVVQYYGILRPQPGATLAFTPGNGIRARNGGRVVARGTQAAPVLFTATDSLGWLGISLEGAPSLSSYLTNVRIEYIRNGYLPGVLAQDSHTLVIDSAVLRQNNYPVGLWSPGSRISRSRVDTSLAAGPAVQLAHDARIESTLIRGSAGSGLLVGYATVQVVSCEIRDSAGDGIELWAAAEVHDCNLVNNGGFGIATVGSFSANVEDNGWGDAGGPTGPNGDGVSGALDFTPWRTTLFVLPYVP